MSAKHTPGPWTAKDGYVSASGFRLIRMDSSTLGPPSREREANARLISAAPDLLEALVKAEWALVVAIRAATASAGFTGDELDEIIRENPAVKSARAAIARATGEQ